MKVNLVPSPTDVYCRDVERIGVGFSSKLVGYALGIFAHTLQRTFIDDTGSAPYRHICNLDTHLDVLLDGLARSKSGVIKRVWSRLVACNRNCR